MTGAASHLPVLIVIVPFAAAYFTPLLGCIMKGWGRRIALGALGATLVCSALLLAEVVRSGPIACHLSGVAPPLGIAFVADYLGACISPLIAAVALVSVYSAADEVPGLGERKSPLFYTLILLAVGAMQGITVTADIFSLFVLFEILAIAMYGLVALGADGRGLIAGYKYLLIGSAGSALVLIGTGFLYVSTGTLNMGMMADLLPPISGSWTVVAGLALLIAGLGTKTGLFPLHVWMPDAYACAPPLAPIVSTLALKAGLLALIRVVYTIFGPSLAAIPLHPVLALLGAIAIVVCSVLAIQQEDIRRMFAYSSGASVGCIVLGIGIATQAGLEGAILHMFTHTLGKVCLFLCADAILLQTGIRTVDEFRGLAGSMPYTMAAFSMASLSLIGIPLTGGFMSKIYVANAAIASGLWVYTAVLLFWTLLTAIYLFRVLNSAYFEAPESPRLHRETGARALVPMLILGTASVLLGFFVEAPMAVIRMAAGLLVGGGL